MIIDAIRRRYRLDCPCDDGAATDGFASVWPVEFRAATLSLRLGNSSSNESSCLSTLIGDDSLSLSEFSADVINSTVRGMTMAVEADDLSSSDVSCSFGSTLATAKRVSKSI